MPALPVARTTATSPGAASAREWPPGLACSRHEISPSGAPARTAASAITSAARRQQRGGRGMRAHDEALPDLTAARHLNSTVEVGLVTGMIPAITPIGAPTAVDPVPVLVGPQHADACACRSMQRATNAGVVQVLEDLVLVDAVARSRRRRSGPTRPAASVPARAMARTMRVQPSSWSAPAKRLEGLAGRARALVRASPMRRPGRRPQPSTGGHETTPWR